MRIYQRDGQELVETAPFVSSTWTRSTSSTLATTSRPRTRLSRVTRPDDVDSLPTARFAFSVEGERVDVLPEHRSPEGYALYEEWLAARARWWA